MDRPTHLGHHILPDRPHVDIETSYKTFFRKQGFQIAITGRECVFKVKFENVFEHESLQETFEWRIIGGEGHSLSNVYDNIYEVKIPKKGDTDYKHFEYTPETSGYHKLFIKVPVSEESNWRVGFHKKDLRFEDGYNIRFRVYSKREILFTIGKIFGIFGAILAAVRLAIFLF